MANEQNLMPIQEVNSRRTREEHSRDSSKGGKKSAEVKRQRKAMKEQLEKNQKSLEKANKKSIKLDNSSKEIKEMVRDLKTTITSKDKYVLKKEDKEKLENYIDSVSQTNEEFKKVQTLSVTLNNVDEELKENKEKIKLLTQKKKIKKQKNQREKIVF